MATRIPLLDLGPQTDELWDQFISVIEQVVRGGRFILGPNVTAFEQEIAQYLGVKHAIGVNSGTDALVIGLRAAGVGPGDEVITTPFSFFATAEGISQVGATPVFADIEPDTFNISPAAVEVALTERTAAILPAHMFGQSVDMAPLLELAAEHGLKLVEDVAQAFGADYRGSKLATIGDVGCISFFPSKPLGAFGDGGMVVTNSDEAAEIARMLRAHGSRKKYYNETMGYNSRLDEIQAAVLRVKLPHIDAWNGARGAVAQRYNELLSDTAVATPVDRGYGRHVFHQYTIRIPNARRDAVKDALAQAGIDTMVYYPVPIHQLLVYAGQSGPMPESEKAAAQVLSLPIWPEISSETQAQVAHALHQAI